MPVNIKFGGRKNNDFSSHYFYLLSVIKSIVTSLEEKRKYEILDPENRRNTL